MHFTKYLIDPSSYEEECDIGKGNFSSVSLVHPKNNKSLNVAMKKISIDPSDNDTQKFFIREVLIMSELNHPNLLKLIGFSLPSKSDNTFKIYSKFLPNKTLIEALKNDQLTSTQKTIIIYGIASAMTFLHKKNIIHRDLKPENVFLDENYQPVLSDFGLSKICGDEINITTKIGTPYFMAPELFYDESNENIITNKIDVYSYAITLLSMFTTNYKFKGQQPRSINQLVNNIINGKRYQIPSNVPKFYENLINQCWQNDQSKRPSFDEILELFESSNDFILEGADAHEVKEFIKKVKNSFDSNKDDFQKANNGFVSSDDNAEYYDFDDDENEEEETKEFDFCGF